MFGGLAPGFGFLAFAFRCLLFGSEFFLFFLFVAVNSLAFGFLFGGLRQQRILAFRVAFQVAVVAGDAVSRFGSFPAVAFTALLFLSLLFG